MSLFKRPGSPFYYTEFVVQGRRIVRSTRATSRREAEQFERTFREQVAKEVKEAPATPSLTVDQACGKYWLEHGRRLRDARNIERWLRYIVCYLDRTLPLKDVGTRHVTQFVIDMRAAGIGEIAINRTVTCLQGVHNRAAKKWEEPVKVIDWREQKTKERPRVRWINQKEAQLFLSLLPEHIRRVVLFLLLVGIRRNEAFGLTWEGVNFSTATITVRVKGGHLRDVAICPEAVLVLHDCPHRGRYVFDTTNWRKHFERARDQSGIQNFRWHDLRHTFATWLGASGAPLEVVRDQLGHSSVSVTQKYRHVNQQEVRAALQRLPTLGTNSSSVVPFKKDISG
jgi:site-specific recombinase XerD